MNLVVDVGNTLIKLAIFDEKRLIYKKTGMKSDFDKNMELILDEFPLVTNVVLSVVGGFSEKSKLKLDKNYTVFNVTAQINTPFINDYATPQTLGVDRIALVSAAKEQYAGKDVLIIDVGTCITYDFLNAEGHYKGGAISPGINMRYKALHEYTERLPLLDANIPQNILGNSTQTSIHSGVINGVTLEIDGVISQYKQDFEDLTVILTGGNAHFLRDRLKNGIFANPNFLLEGLNFLLEYNQNT